MKPKTKNWKTSHLSLVNDNVNNDIDYEYLNIAQDILPNEPWNTETWDQWILKIKEKHLYKQ